MFEPHPTFKLPSDGDAKVWRYMDFTKLVSILDQKALYFARTDSFEDPFEGSVPKVNVLLRKIVPPGILPGIEEVYLKKEESLSSFTRAFREHVFVNCWHMNEAESAAMWKLYLASGEGIAIQSTVNRLKESLKSDDAFYIGKVNYIDYDREFIDTDNIFNPVVHKRKSFEHERELRVVLAKWPTEARFGGGIVERGVSVTVDLDTLVEGIYLAPKTAPWLSNLTGSVLQKYGRRFPLYQSKLDEQPLF